MDWLHAIILGVIEGIAEFLPISSTGHLILVSQLLGIAQSDFQKTFEIVIQLGAILAVLVLYWRSFFDIEILKRLIVGFIPTGIIGFLLYKVVKNYLLGNESVVLWALLLGGLALIVFEYWHQEHPEAHNELRTIPYKTAALIGVFQALAVVPGVSRSAATIVGGLLLGLKRTTIVEFSFLLAVPTMLAASGLDLLKSPSVLNGPDLSLLVIGFVATFVVALVAIKWLLSFVRGHSFVPFGVYRVVIAILFFILVIR